MVVLLSVGRREPIHGGFAAASLLLRPTENKTTTFAFQLCSLNDIQITTILKLNYEQIILFVVPSLKAQVLVGFSTGLSSRDAAAKPTGMYLRRPVEKPTNT